MEQYKVATKKHSFLISVRILVHLLPFYLQSELDRQLKRACKLLMHQGTLIRSPFNLSYRSFLSRAYKFVDDVILEI